MPRPANSLQSKIIDRMTLYEGVYLSLYRDNVLLPNGHRTVREIVRAPNAVGVVAIDSGGHVVLVRQYREAVQREIVGIPAGVIHEDDGETGWETACRELEEETGYTAGRMDLIVPAYYFAEGFCNATMELYLARGLLPAAHPVVADAAELLEVLLMPFEEACERNVRGEFSDAKTKLGLLAAQITLAAESG